MRQCYVLLSRVQPDVSTCYSISGKYHTVKQFSAIVQVQKLGVAKVLLMHYPQPDS